MAHLSLLAVLALAFSGVASAAPALGGLSARDSQSFTPCRGLNTILSVNISPDPPVAGEGLDVIVTVYTPVPISAQDNAVAQATVTHDDQVVWTQSVNVCNTASCPVQPGTYSFTYHVQLPEGVSTNEINILTNGYSPSYGPLFCFDFTPE